MFSAESGVAKSVESCGPVCTKDKQKESLHDSCLKTGRSFSFKKLGIGRHKERLSDSENILF